MKLVDCSTEYWEFVRNLRNNKKVLDGFIDSVYITIEMQSKYMEKYSNCYRVAVIDNVPVDYVGGSRR